MLFLSYLIICSQIGKGVQKKKSALIRKINVFPLQYSLLYQVYKYLKANTFNDQGIDPALIKQIIMYL